MLARLTRILVVAALCVSIGAHWAALQSVAWTTMIVANASHEPLAKAVADTFDGDHPCALCKHIAAARHSQKENKAAPTTPKLDLIGNPCAITFLTFCSGFRFPPLEMRAFLRPQTPPTPPPRSGQPA